METPLNKKTHNQNYQNPLKNQGFSLVEVLVVAGIMGGMALFAMQLLDNQTKSAKDFETRMNILSATMEIRNLLSNPLNCTETFRDANFENSLSDPETTIINTILDIKNPEVEPMEFRNTYNDRSNGGKFSGLGFLIESYHLSDVEEDVEFSNDNPYRNAYLKIKFYRGKDALGGSHVTKKVKINFRFDPESKELTSCSSSIIGGAPTKPLTIVDPLTEEALKDKTGEEACAIKGLNCSYVTSTNYVSSYTSENANGVSLSYLCAISYNTNLSGVKQGTPIPNVHSCEAKLGNFQTYSLSSNGTSVTCAAIFMAVCN